MKYSFQIELNKTYCQRDKAKKPLKAAAGKLKKSLALAHQLADYMDSNNLSFEEASKLIGVSVARISQIMSLLFLAPEIQERIIFSGENMQHLTVREIYKVARLILWDEQRDHKTLCLKNYELL